MRTLGREADITPGRPSYAARSTAGGRFDGLPVTTGVLPRTATARAAQPEVHLHRGGRPPRRYRASARRDIDDLEQLFEHQLRPMEVAQQRLRRALLEVVAQFFGDLDFAGLGELMAAAQPCRLSNCAIEGSTLIRIKKSLCSSGLGHDLGATRISSSKTGSTAAHAFMRRSRTSTSSGSRQSALARRPDRTMAA